MNSKFHQTPDKMDNFATLAVHGGYSAEGSQYMPIAEPLYCSSTYRHSKPGEFEEFNYSRSGNPNRKTLEKRLASLEGAKYCVTFPTGLSVTFAIAHLFHSGDHFIVSNDIYGGTMNCFVNLAKRSKFHVEYADFTDINALQEKLQNDTKLVWFESPTNPTMTVVDIRAICETVKSVAKEAVIVVDNTALTSYFQRPLELGATISMYSLTKFMNGHADVVMGAAITNCDGLYEGLKFMQDGNGICPAPFDCYQTLRGLKTLALRMEQQQKSGLQIAKRLETNPFVKKVNHPGLASHPQHELAMRQSRGHSGIMSFEIKGGLEEAEQFMGNLKVIQMAASFGGVESLIASPALMSHFMISQEKRDKMGITDSLIRLSVGIESADYLIADIEQALEKVNFKEE